MRNPSEIYFYIESDFAGRTDRVVNLLKEKGHKVIVGRDHDELILLVEMSDPSAIFCALTSQTYTEEESFRKLSERAFKQEVPIIVMGPDDPRDGFTMHSRSGDKMDQSHLPFNALSETTLSLNRSQSAPDVPAAATPSPMTEDRADVQDRFAPKHHESLDSLLPKPPDPAEDEGEVFQYQGEINRPINLPNEAGEKKEGTRNRMTASPKLHMALTAAAFVFASFGIYSATIPAPPPRAPEKKTPGPSTGISPAKKSIDPQKNLSPPGATKSPTPSLSSTNVLKKENSESLQSSTDTHTRVPNWDRSGIKNVLPFPGTFRPGTSTYWFQNEWEINHFREMLQRIPEESTVELIGYATEKEVKEGNGDLELSRAWAVMHFLKREGIDLERIRVTRGGHFPAKIDLDDRGRPRNRLVEIVIDPAE